MKSGFLCLQTHRDHPGLVRILCLEKLPELTSRNEPARIRYVARFRDLEAGQMHLHQMIRRGLTDLENRIYRGRLEVMAADLESIELEHRRIWIDPSLSKAQLEEIAYRSSRLMKRKRYRHLAWQSVGAAGILLLLLNAL